jgi:hypothetical protein
MNAPKRNLRLKNRGHAGSHLRGALADALDWGTDWWQYVEIDFHNDRDQEWWSKLSARSRARWLLGQLWHCTDIVPGALRSEFEGQNVITYARLARLLINELQTSEAAAA